jgi:2-dehydropantoate 2-reductase
MIRHCNYAILGTGALGGFYGARLQRAGFEVHFLLHSDYEYVSQHGLIVESAEGDFASPIFVPIATQLKCRLGMFSLLV